ncbi:hypothetical protein ACFVGM_08815 [Kitasatospora purpeofusca]|uniref:hypothetical protein n=1 Tax=Kitasatospora purpeofusca TaxID=67352 RepID=UPI0036B285A0
MGRAVTLGIAGAGQASQDLIFDTLNDQFDVGPQDADGYFASPDGYDIHLILPATEATATAAVAGVCEWAIRCELPYTICTDGNLANARIEFMTRNLIDPSQAVQVEADGVHTAVLDRLTASEHPMLLLLLTDGAFDNPLIEELAAQALTADIPVFDLSRAFLEIGWDDLPTHEKPAAEIEVEPDGQLALVLTESDGERIVLNARELTILRRMFAEVDEAIDRISFLHEHLTPMRRALVGAKEVLLAPPPPGRSSGGKRQRMEILDEATGEWVPAGRGRPKQGVPRRYVDRDPS